MIPQEHKSGLILLTGNIENILQVLFYFFCFGRQGGLPRLLIGLEFSWVSGSPPRVISPHRGQLVMSGEFGLSIWGATGVYWVVTRDAANYPTMHRRAPA